MVRPWHRLPTEVLDAPSLKVFKARLGGALSKLVWVDQWQGLGTRQLLNPLTTHTILSFYDKLNPHSFAMISVSTHQLQFTLDLLICSHLLKCQSC